MNKLDKILLALGIFILLFVVSNEIIFCIKDAIPSELVIAVFGCCGFELFFTAWIKNNNKKKKKKKDVKEDEMVD